MIKKIMDGLEYFYCSKCGERYSEYNDYCDVCGYESQGLKTEVVLDKSYLEEDETMCIVIGAELYGKYIFTQLKIDFAHRMVGFTSGRIMEDNIDHFYVFKKTEYPYLRKDMQINLNLNNYTYIETSNNFKIYYDKNQFSFLDIIKLKSYRFDYK